MTTVTVTHAICPHCGQRTSTVDHCTAEWFPPWSCAHCGGWYEVRRAPPGGTGSDFQVRKAIEGGKDKPVWPLHWVLLQRGTVRLLLRSRRCASWNEDHDEYFYNEHTCPTNYMRDVVAIADGPHIDPHGVFEFVKTWPVKDGEDGEDAMRDRVAADGVLLAIADAEPIEDIDAMEAGPELDRLVAKKAMGWGPVNHSPEYADGRGRGTDSFHPSTDIRNAWEVVERLRAAGFFWSMQDMRDGSFVVHLVHKERRVVGVFHEKDRCVAICRAALQAFTA